MVEKTDQDLDIEFDDYEALEANAEAISEQPVANQNRRQAPQMNEQDVEYADEEVIEEEVEATPAPKPVRQKQPHASNMSARDRKPVPVINPNTGRPERVKSTEEELDEMSAAEATEDVEAEANQLASEERMPKWMPFHQPEKIGVINTQTREIIEGFKDDGSAAGTAKILNEIDSMIVSGGYQ